MAERATEGARDPDAEHSVALDQPIEEELLEWYLLSPAQRWRQSQQLWANFIVLGGSLDPEPDSQSPFDFPGERRGGSLDGGPGLHSVRRGGV